MIQIGGATDFHRHLGIVTILPHLTRQGRCARLEAVQHAIGHSNHLAVTDAPVERRGVVVIGIGIDRRGHLDGIVAAVDEDGMQRDGGLGRDDAHGHRRRHLAQGRREHAASDIATGLEGVAAGSAQRGVTRQGHALHILVDEFADAVIAQDAGCGGGVLRQVDAVQVKGDARHLVVLLAHCLDEPAASHSPRVALSGGVDDFAEEHHLGRAAGVHVDDLGHVGAHLLQDLACHRCGAACRLAVERTRGLVDNQQVEMLAIGTAAVAGARIHLAVVGLVIVAAQQFATVHYGRIAPHHVLDVGALAQLVVIQAGPPRGHLNLVAHSKRRHRSLVSIACDGQAGVIVAQRLTVGIGDDAGDDEPHGRVVGPAATLGQGEVIVVRVVVAPLVEARPVVLELAGAGIVGSIQADVARHGAAVDVVVGQRLREFVAGDGAIPTDASQHQRLVVGDGGGCRALRAAVPPVPGGVVVDQAGVVTHHAAQRSAQLETAPRRPVARHDPEVGVAARHRALGGRAVARVGIGQGLGAAHGVIADGSLDAVVGIVEVHFHYIHVERIAGNPHDGIDHAGPHLAVHQRVDTIDSAINHKVGTRRYTGQQRHDKRQEEFSIHHTKKR